MSLSHMAAPLVSVLIPLYNHEKYIIRCLESIVSDDYSHKEVIIIDDGSTDDSVSIVERWISENRSNLSYPVTLISRPNVGVSKTLNELISISKGKYICFIASDDYLLPGGIDARVDYLKHHPTKLAVFADSIVVNATNHIVYNSTISEYYNCRKKYLSDCGMLLYELVFSWCCVTGPVLMVDRCIFEKIGYFDESLFIDDWDYYLRMSQNNLLGFLDRTVAAYRIHGRNTLDHSKGRILLAAYMTVWKHARNYHGLIRLYLSIHKYFSKAVIGLYVNPRSRTRLTSYLVLGSILVMIRVIYRYFSLFKLLYNIRFARTAA